MMMMMMMMITSSQSNLAKTASIRGGKSGPGVMFSGSMGSRPKTGPGSFQLFVQ